jgi:hypothetical protein
LDYYSGTLLHVSLVGAARYKNIVGEYLGHRNLKRIQVMQIIAESNKIKLRNLSVPQHDNYLK